MISDERLSHISHLIKEELLANNIIASHEGAHVLKQIKLGLDEFQKAHREVDKAARSHLTSQKKEILEGTREWDVLYGRFYEQELTKKGM